uniref:UTP--glucose-1-phosphate uridylyltransferase n=1 Tax=Ciona intestinalis TaxID=7719 RepID=F6X4W9_CIOIN
MLGIRRQSSTNYVDWELLFSDPNLSPSRGSTMQRTQSIMEFQQLMKNDAKSALRYELDKLGNTAEKEYREIIKKDLANFETLFKRFLLKSGPSIVWNDIKSPPEGYIKSYSEISKPTLSGTEKHLLSKLVVVKLNGGLGTSMGCTGPKSLISVRSGLTFLDLTVQQIESLNKKYDAQVPLVLMNSFNTDDDTNMILRKYASCHVKIHTFNQNRYPRINKESLLPIAQSCNDPLEAWYPPGHGDVYECFVKSGLLDKFVKEGREFVFVSNIDNLGATIDLNILNMLVNPPEGSKPCDFVMEVTDKTRADVKGGTLIEYENKLRLLEIAQVPKEHVDEFKSVSKFKIFNTNNLWMSMQSISELTTAGKMEMEVIVNNKRLANGTNVIQLETASGAGIKNFHNAIGINVPRSRFLPVKKTSDLLLVMSNLYELKNGSMVMSSKRQFPTTPLVILVGSKYRKINQLLIYF